MTVTRFNEATLPAGWTATEPSLGHVTVGSGYLSLATDAGADFDSLSGGTNVPEGPRVGIAVAGSFDYAVHMITPINCAPNIGIDLLAWDQANTQGIRFAHYVSAITGRDGSFYGRRNTPSATNNISLTATPSNLYGPRQWLRMKWDQATSTWTLMSSHTGKPGTWHTHATFTNTFVPTSFEIAMTAVSPDGVGREIRVYSVVDMTSRSDDATTPASTPIGGDIVTLSPNLSGPSLPAELTGTTNAGATITTDLGVTTLTIDSNAADSYAWVEADVEHDGLTCMYKFPQPSVQNCFGAIAIHGRKTTDIPRAAVIPDKYRPGTGLLFEVNGGGSFGDIVRVLDAHIVSSDSNYDASSAMEFYGFAMKNENLTAAVDGSTGNWIRMRFEHREGYYRLRFWYDGDPEPSSWDYEGEDWSQEGTGISFVMAHNDSTTGAGGGTASMQISSIQAYNVDDEPETEPIRLGNGHEAKAYRLAAGAGHNVFATPPGTLSRFTDGTPNILVVNGFYTYTSGAEGWRCSGARLYVPELVTLDSVEIGLWPLSVAPNGPDLTTEPVRTGVIDSPVEGWNEVRWTPLEVEPGVPFWIGYDLGAGEYLAATDVTTEFIQAADGATLVLGESNIAGLGFRSYFRIGAGATEGASGGAWYGVDAIVDEGSTGGLVEVNLKMFAV